MSSAGAGSCANETVRGAKAYERCQYRHNTDPCPPGIRLIKGVSDEHGAHDDPQNTIHNANVLAHGHLLVAMEKA
jgi:hypothetical protein